MQEDRKIFTLTELGKSLRSVIERSYTSTYWVKAEIARLNYYPRSGHCYPELVDKSGNVIQAQMRATIWAADFKQINRQFTRVAGDTLREGMSILFRASVGYHPVYGLSLQIWEVEPAFTLGEMALEKSKNIERLKKEGIFDFNKALFMPLLPKRLAIISVETSKGYSDFLKILNEQATNYAWWHFLFPTVLQGDKAAEGIISQLRIIKKVQHRFDMVAIIRGGGGDIGLNCYDDYHLAREIAAFPLPVITGIGHATNETIAEMVAWSNKITPTDVAYFVVDKFKSFGQRIENSSNLIRSKALSLLSFRKQTLDYLDNRVRNSPQYMLSAKRNHLNNMTSTLLSLTKAIHQERKNILDNRAIRLSLMAPKLICKQQCAVEKKVAGLEAYSMHLIERNNHCINLLAAKTDLIDPENVLRRGYSITSLNGKRVINAKQVKLGDELVTRLSEGELLSKIIKKQRC